MHVKTANDIINIVQAIKSSIDNATQLLDLEVNAKSVGGQGGKGTCVLKCYQCQQTGHLWSNCKVLEKDLYCKNCKTRHHNTHEF